MKYITLKDTNVLLRKALAEAFPGIKFSVVGQSYSGGASTNVRWVDGPTSQAVKEICDQFEGASFDGMIDLKSSKYGLLDGEVVHYGADYIFENRSFSPEVEAKAKQIVHDAYVEEGWDPENHNYVGVPQAIYRMANEVTGNHNFGMAEGYRYSFELIVCGWLVQLQNEAVKA